MHVSTHICLQQLKIAYQSALNLNLSVCDERTRRDHAANVVKYENNQQTKT